MCFQVNYSQKNAASGRIPMNYFRRDIGPTERETLTGRIIGEATIEIFPQVRKSIS